MRPQTFVVLLALGAVLGIATFTLTGDRVQSRALVALVPVAPAPIDCTVKEDVQPGGAKPGQSTQGAASIIGATQLAATTVEKEQCKPGCVYRVYPTSGGKARVVGTQGTDRTKCVVLVCAGNGSNLTSAAAQSVGVLAKETCTPALSEATGRKVLGFAFQNNAGSWSAIEAAAQPQPGYETPPLQQYPRNPPAPTSPLPQQPNSPDPGGATPSPVPPVGSGGTGGQTPIGGIGDIANPAPGSGSGTQNPTRPAPRLARYIVSDIVNTLARSGSGSSGSGGSYTAAPGTQGTGFSPVVRNYNFDALSSQVTFAQPGQTPFQSIAKLSGSGSDPANTTNADDRVNSPYNPIAAQIALRQQSGANSGGVTQSPLGTFTKGLAVDVKGMFDALSDSVFKPIVQLFGGIVPSSPREAQGVGEENRPGETGVPQGSGLTLEENDLTLMPGDPTRAPDEISDTPPPPPRDLFHQGGTIESSLTKTPEERIGDLAVLSPESPTTGSGSGVAPAYPPAEVPASGIEKPAREMTPTALDAPPSVARVVDSVREGVSTAVTKFANLIRSVFSFFTGWF